MWRMVLTAAAAAGLTLVAAPARAEEDSAVVANGSCEFHAGTDSNNCYHVTRYIRVDQGRTTFFVDALGKLSFTGTRLSSTAGRQTLEVDGVSNGYKGADPVEPARGACEASLSADGRTFLKVTCHARSAAGVSYDFTFTGDGMPTFAVPTPRHDPAGEAAAFAALKASADGGDLTGQVRLAVAYETADRTPENLPEAARLFHIAADRGSPEAMRRLGDLHRYGLGVKRDRREALRWYRLAADHGDAEAMFHLGEMIGENDADEDEARDWYRKSAEAGFVRAMTQTAHDARDFAEARRWLEKGVSLGDASAMKVLSERLYHEGGLPGDTAEAERLSKLADIRSWDTRMTDAASGDEGAMYLVAAAYDGAFEFPRDAVQAVRWYRMAAERGDGVAQSELARILEEGRGVPKDPVEAKYWRDQPDAREAEPDPEPAEAKTPPPPPLAAGDPMTMPLERLIADVEHQHPGTYFILAKRLMDVGRADEAVFWFYVGQLRWGAYLSRHSSEAQVFLAMKETLGQPLNEYIGGDIQAWVAMIDKVLAWDASHPDNFTRSRDARERTRAALIDLRQQIIVQQDDIRAARAHKGLPNRNPARVEQGAGPGPAQAEHSVGGKTVAEVFQDPRVAALARAACAPDAAAAVPREVAAGADPKAVGLLGATPLFWAFTCRNPAGMEALLKAGADPNYTYPGKGGASVVFAAASLKDGAYLKLLLRYHGDPNAGEVEGSKSALMAAMEAAFESGDWGNYYALLDGGADINRVYGYGETIATLAALRNEYDKLIELLERGYTRDLDRIGAYVQPDPRRRGEPRDPPDKSRDRLIEMLKARGVHFPVRLGARP